MYKNSYAAQKNDIYSKNRKGNELADLKHRVRNMKVDENSNFTSGNVYTITMNFYTGNSLIEQAEISYYYGGE